MTAMIEATTDNPVPSTAPGQDAREGDAANRAGVLPEVPERVTELDCENGYILDGFPRTVAQAQALDAMLEVKEEKLDFVLYLNVPADEVLARLTARREQEGRVRE